MKIIKQGGHPTHSQWYFRARLVCRECGCQFQLEPGDSFQHYPGDQREPGGSVQVACPSCRTMVTAYIDV